MIANAVQYENPRANERHDLTPAACGGYLVSLTGNFPKTDIDILMPPCGPLKMRMLIDCDGDARPDHEAVNVLTFHDVDGDGVIERDGDALMTRTEFVTALPGVPFDFDGADRLAAARLAVTKLGGNPGDVVEPEEEDDERFDGMGRA